jgi:NADPH:quinone reductase-like Zn-dependent oxidoreductase
VDVFFDPVANGPYLDAEIQALAHRGTIWIYGLLGKPGVLDLTPLIRKQASIRGWVLGELLTADPAERLEMQREVLRHFETGVYRQRIAARFRLEEVRQAHETMERAEHIGKIVLIP